jgi:hypothetical protein
MAKLTFSILRKMSVNNIEMNNGSSAKKARGPMKAESKAKSSASIKQTNAAKKAVIEVIGNKSRSIKKANLNAMNKAGISRTNKNAIIAYLNARNGVTKKNSRPKTPNFNPFNNANMGSSEVPANAMNSFAALLNKASAAPTAAMPLPATIMGIPVSANTKKSTGKKANLSVSNAAKRAKKSNAQKKSTASTGWMANVNKVQNSLGVSRQEAMVIASTKRKEKAGTAKSRNNNVNLLGFTNLSISNKKPTAAVNKYNQNLITSLGM